MSVTTVHSGRYIRQDKLATLLFNLFGDDFDCQVGLSCHLTGLLSTNMTYRFDWADL
jgi:hypothetical protein